MYTHDVVCLELLYGLVAQHRLQARVEFLYNLGIDAFVIVGDAVVGRDAHLVFAGDSDNRERAAFELGFEHVGYLLCLHGLIEAYNIVATAREVDTLAQSAHTERNAHDYYQDEAYDVACLAFAQEVDIVV